MTRAASSQALARCTASSAGIGAGAAFDELADFWAASAGAVRSSGSCCAKAAAAKIAGKSRRTGRRKRIATKSSPLDRPLRRRIGGDRAGYWESPAFPQALRSLYGGLAALTGLSDIGERRLERGAEAFNDRVDLASLDDEGRRQQNMVAGHGIDCPAHRIDHQPPRHRLALDARMEFRRGIE